MAGQLNLTRRESGSRNPGDASANARILGYEIHAGVTTGPALERPAVRLCEAAPDASSLHPDYKPDGAISGDGQILGTYVHGVFDTPEACDAVLAWAGLEAPRSPDLAALREASIERLADTIAGYMDTNKLMAILEGRQ